MRRRMTDLFDDLPVEQLNKLDNQTQVPSTNLKKPKHVFNMKWVAAIIIVVGVAFGGTAALASPKLFESKHKITICIDVGVESDVQAAIFMWKKFYGEESISVEVIPSDVASAEAKIARIRTQIMAGKGPDVFILSSPNPQDVEGVALFDNPELAMRNEVFLPLDGFMSTAQYMNPDNWNTTILNAGRTEEGQMVIPMTYEYMAMVCAKDSTQEDDSVPRYAFNGLPLTSMYSFGNLCDYDKKELLYDEDTIFIQMKHLESDYDAYKNMDPTKSYASGSYGPTSGFLFESLFGAEEEIYVPYTNANGGINATVTAYAAINANTKKAEKAFEFLDIICSDYLLSGYGFPLEGYDYRFCGGHRWDYGISIYNEDKIAGLVQVTDEENAMIREVTDRIDQVRFRSNMDKDLMNIYESMIYSAPGSLTDDELRSLISDMLERWKLQLAE